MEQIDEEILQIAREAEHDLGLALTSLDAQRKAIPDDLSRTEMQRLLDRLRRPLSKKDVPGFFRVLLRHRPNLYWAYLTQDAGWGSVVYRQAGIALVTLITMTTFLTVMVSSLFVIMITFFLFSLNLIRWLWKLLQPSYKNTSQPVRREIIHARQLRWLVLVVIFISFQVPLWLFAWHVEPQSTTIETIFALINWLPSMAMMFLQLPGEDR